MNDNLAQRLQAITREIVALLEGAESVRSDEFFVRMKYVTAVTGLSRATIYRLISAGDFPEPMHLSARSSQWSKREIDEWARMRMAK